MKKRIILLILAVVCILAAGAETVIAYFSSLSGPVINTFTVGDVNIALTETTGQSYLLVPGATVEKDPVATVRKGSEACYLYVKLEWRGNLDDYVTYQLADGWYPLGGIDGVYYRAVEHAAVDMNYPVLDNDQLTVTNTLTKETMATVDQNECQLIVTAYAIQSLGMESPADGWYNLLDALEE